MKWRFGSGNSSIIRFITCCDTILIAERPKKDGLAWRVCVVVSTNWAISQYTILYCACMSYILIMDVIEPGTSRTEVKYSRSCLWGLISRACIQLSSLSVNVQNSELKFMTCISVDLVNRWRLYPLMTTLSPLRAFEGSIPSILVVHSSQYLQLLCN